jgi:hypothetical protein
MSRRTNIKAVNVKFIEHRVAAGTKLVYDVFLYWDI